MRMLSKRISSVPYAYAQHAHQFLTHMLSMVCRNLYNEWPLKNGETDAYAQHTQRRIEVSCVNGDADRIHSVNHELTDFFLILAASLFTLRTFGAQIN